MGRAPLPPALPTQDTLQELLDENDSLLQASLAFQRHGHVAESIEFLRRSHVNVVAMVRLLRRQQELERPSPSVAQRKEACVVTAVKEIALKKPPVKRRRKSEVDDNQPQPPHHHQQQQQQVPPIEPNNRPLDMPSLL